MASFTFKQAHPQLTSFSHCKYSCSTLNIFKFHSHPTVSISRKHKPHHLVKAHVAGTTVNNVNSCSNDDYTNGPVSFASVNGNTGRKVILRDTNAKKGLDPGTRKGEDKARNLVGQNSEKKISEDKDGSNGVVGNKGRTSKKAKVSNEVVVQKKAKTSKKAKVHSPDGSDEAVVQKKGKPSKKKAHSLDGSDEVVVEKKGKSSKKANVHSPDGSNEVEVEKKGKTSKKAKVHLPELNLRVGLEMCSKRGDVVGAIELYESARKEGIKMGQYHFGVLLYLCSSAATGVVQPAKSGSRSRSLNAGNQLKESSVVSSDSTSGFSEGVERHHDFRAEVVASGGLDNNSSDVESGGSVGVPPQSLDSLVQVLEKRNSERLKTKKGGDEVNEIQISDDVKRLALQKGFEIYNEICAQKIPMNEATFTSVARMAMAFEDGDMAFDMVKQMKEHGINPRLRSYGPALAIYSSKGDVEKAFMVEKHMLADGVYPEEPELGTLLKVSIGSGKSDRVYYVMHKLRTSVRQVSPVTADLIQSWFESKTAARVGKRKWNKKLVTEAIISGGGGWHGKGWLGTGKWKVCRSPIGSNGVCKSCGEKLVTIDLDPEETERFAQSVASLAAQREKHSSFQKFQKWLDYYGPFEVVVDGANVGLLSQRSFKPSRVNAVVNEIRQMSPSRKWPLIILHNRRITGGKMDEPLNKALIEKWKNADALYATPTGSNDDWYWLYAAIKCKCLLVTNDEMRDHLLQLLGNDFFPKWKERHQVHLSFSEDGAELRMPPPYSVVIQESEKGHWHVPIASEVEHEDQRIWLCCTRANSSLADHDSAGLKEDLPQPHQKKAEARKGAKNGKYIQRKLETHEIQNCSKQVFQELNSNIKTLVASSMSEKCHSILPRIKAAEKLGSCLIDFQI